MDSTIQTSTLELWLVRHGQTEFNVERRLAGWKNVSLTTFGDKQAHSLLPILKNIYFDTVWSSDLSRSIRTAQLAFDQAPRIDVRLREIDFGLLDGQLWIRIDESYRDALLQFKKFVAPRGESLEDLSSRINSFIQNLLPGRHLIFTHRGVIRTITKKLGYDKFLPPGSIIAVNWTQQKVIFEHLGEEN